MIRRPAAFRSDERQVLSGPQLLVTAFFIVVIAQALLIQAVKQPGFWDAQNWTSNLKDFPLLPIFLLYILGALIFIWGLTLTGHIQTPLPISTTIPKASLPRFGFWTTCMGLSIILAYSMATSPNPNGLLLTMIWLLNIVLLIVSVCISINWQPPAIEVIKQWFRTHFWELIGVLMLVLAAFMIRFWNIELHPYAFMNDEGEMGISAICIQQGICDNPFEIGWAAQPVLAFVPTLLSISIFGHTATAVRLTSVIIGTLAVLAVYLFTKQVFGQKEAWLATALLAVLPVHVHFSRLGVDNIVDSLSTTVVLGFLFFGLKRGSSLSFLAAGIVGGLCMYTYPGTRLAPIIGMGAIGYIALKIPGFLKAHAFNICIYVFSLLVTAAPIAGYFLANQNMFFARMNRESIFQDSAFHSGNIVNILFAQFMKSSLVFTASTAPTNFFNSPRPYLTPLAAIFLVLGLFYVIWRIKEDRYLILFVWFWAAIILGSTLTGGAPTSQRMLMSTPALAIITAIGICKITENIPGKFGNAISLQAIFLIAFAIWVGYKDVSFYHYEYRINHYFEEEANELTYETAVSIAQLHAEGRLYLMTNPKDDYLSFANFNFFSPDVEKAYMNEVTRESLAGLPKDKDILFIATPDQLENLKKVASLIMGGEWKDVPRRYQPAYMLYYSYKIKQSDLQAFKP